MIDIDENNTDTFVMCPVCSKKMSKINHWHIKSHGYTVTDFETKFGITSKQRSCIKLRKSVGCTLELMIKKYGADEGRLKFETYRKKQSIKNTYEYKRQKYGWSKTQFDEYNKSRSCTLKNFCRRYGDNEGSVKWKEYRELQSYTGSSEEYFINKLGVDEGTKKWKEICEHKKLTLQNFLRKYGEEEGNKRWEEYILKKQYNNKRGYSTISQDLFNKINEVLKADMYTIYYSTYNYEYIFNKAGIDNIFFVDFFHLPSRKVIEFYGDYWHGNPEMYGDDFMIRQSNRTAKEVRDYDSKRVDTLKREFNVDVLTVWENEYKQSPEGVLEKCLIFLRK